MPFTPETTPVTTTTRTSFSTNCPICQKGKAVETHARPHTRMLMVPNSHDPLSTMHYGIVRGFKCYKCSHKWEELVEDHTAIAFHERHLRNAIG